MDENRPVRLLSLDGGGIRGISSILILKEVMRQINIDRKPKDHLQPWQVFDLIGGTSTGGIIALMLGCLKMSVDECHDTYMKLAKTIFKPKRWRCNVFNRSLDLISANERYDSAKMEGLVQQIIKERTGSRNAMLQDPLRGSPCKVFVTTVRADDEELLLLRSYVNNQQPDTHSSQFEMWEALRATSAASTYFKEYRRQNEGYVDGAFKSNNPIFEVHHEAADLWPGRDVFLVSIGTGTKPSAPVGTNAIKLVRTMTKLATATEGSWVRFQRTHKQLVDEHRLFRFSAPGIGAVDLGNSKMIGNVAMRTDTYLRDTRTAREVASCSREMVEIQTKQYTTVHKLSNSERECLKLLSGAAGPYESQRLSIERPVQGTCQWFLSHKAFMSWLKDTSSALLWVTANPGCGKTVLSSFLVDVLSRQSSDAIVCHFFFKAGEVSRQHSHQALCGILHQVFKAYAKAIKFAMDDFSSNDAANFAQNIEALWEVLCLVSDSLPSRQIICVIDALDECSEDSRNRLIDLLVKTFPQMTGSRKLLGRLKIIVTSRPWPSIETQFRSLSCVRLRGENESSSLSKDIETMVKAKVERLKVEGTLSPEACSMLETTLAQGADRTFLWASLVLESMSRLPSRKMSAVKSALDVTPVDLNQLYENALSDVKDRTASTRLLQVVLAASRPLTLVEVNMAMSISPKHRTVQELLSDIEPNIEYTVKQLGGFFVRVMNSTVHLVHQTARDFLQRTVGTVGTDPSSWKQSLEASRCHSALAQATVSFLLLEGWPIRDLAPSKDKAEASNLTLLQSFPSSTSEFYAYAAQNWPYHAQKQEDSSNSDTVTRQQIATLCRPTWQGFHNWWYFWAGKEYFYGAGNPIERTSPDDSLGLYPLHFAAWRGYYVVMRGLTDSQPGLLTSRNHTDLDCLVVATLQGRVSVVRWLLHTFDPSCLQSGIALVATGSTEITRLLVKTGVDLGKRYRSLQSEKEEATVLESAIYREGKLAHLLAKGAGGLDEAIYRAAEEGKAASLQMLLTAEDKRTEEERLRSLQSALKAASERGRASTRRILLGAGVPELEGTNLSAGLAKAVTFGCTKDNIEALVQDGARDVDGEALLSRAVFGDLESITWLFSVLDYPPEVLSQVTSAFFDMHLGDGLRGYLLKTVERVLLSERRRLTSGFAIKPVIGQDQATNEQFLILLSAKRARVPAAKFHQAVCFSIAADERLALFLLKHRSILQDISDVSGEHEYLALACLWGNLDIVKNICEEKRRLGQLPKLPWGLLLRTAVVSGNAKTVRWILENGNNNGHVEATSEVVGEEFAAQWAVVERVLGFASAAASPLDIAARFGYQDVIATLTSAR